MCVCMCVCICVCVCVCVRKCAREFCYTSFRVLSCVILSLSVPVHSFGSRSFSAKKELSLRSHLSLSVDLQQNAAAKIVPQQKWCGLYPLNKAEYMATGIGERVVIRR